MLKKLMATLGVGSAKVNLILDKQQYRIGDTVKGKVVIQGGNIDQEVNSLDIEMVLNFNIRGKEFSRVVHTFNVTRKFFINKDTAASFPIEHYLPYDYPVTKGATSYHLLAKMDISRSTDAKDIDNLFVLPSREMELIIDAFGNFGFKEKIGSGTIERYGQEFIHYPTSYFVDQIEELSFKILRENNNIKLFMEFKLNDGAPFSGAAYHTEMEIPSELLQSNTAGQIAEHIKEFIDSELSQVQKTGHDVKQPL